MTSDERVKYWTQGRVVGNFGDWLTDLLLDRALVAPLVDADRYRLLGSTIDEAVLAHDLSECADVEQPCMALWGCGKRDARALSRHLADACLFFGVRGPLTRDALGLPVDTPLGDPGLLLPLLYTVPPRSNRASRTLCVPHFNEPADPEQLRLRCGADGVELPQVGSTEDVLRLIDRIATADFVLAGSLHAAITACAYGVPFGYWDTGFVDCPFKWADFAASLDVEIPFCDSVAQARAHYAEFGPRLRLPSRLALLACAPYAVRPSVQARAMASESPTVLSAQQEDRWRERILAHNAARRTAASARGAAGMDGATRRRWRDAEPRITQCLQSLSAQVRSLGFDFSEGAELRFAAGQAGAAFLVSGWTEPNEVAPWSLGSASSMRLPHESRWWAGAVMQIGMIAFIPDVPPFQRQRSVVLRANDMDLGTFVLRNDGAELSTYQAITVNLPETLRQRAGDLWLVFENAPALSAATLGLGTDDRTVAIAPTYAKLMTP